MARTMFSDDEARPQQVARSGESSRPDPVLNIVIKCMEIIGKSPIKILRKIRVTRYCILYTVVLIYCTVGCIDGDLGM